MNDSLFGLRIDRRQWPLIGLGCLVLLAVAVWVGYLITNAESGPPKDPAYYTGPEYNKRGDYVVNGKIVEKNALHLNEGAKPASKGSAGGE